MRRSAPLIAIATCAEFPLLFAEEQELIPKLAAQDVLAVPAVWDDPDVRWEQFAAVVVRSTWGYHSRFVEFNQWLGSLQRRNIALFNAHDLMRWNLDKHYLRQLERRGIPIVPTHFVDPDMPLSLEAVLAKHGWTEAVLKPTISAGADRTVSFSTADAATHQPLADEILKKASVMVQPFANEIVEDGEWSLVFFGGEYSHAVRKRPAKGDFRVQQQFGGTTERVDPSPELRAQAQQALAALPSVPLYARMDGIRRAGQFLLMEAELVEPYLYLQSAPEQAAVFAELLAREVLRLPWLRLPF